MDPEQDTPNQTEDVDMIAAPDAQLEEAADSSQGTVQGDTSPPSDACEMKTELPLRNGIVLPQLSLPPTSVNMSPQMFPR